LGLQQLKQFKFSLRHPAFLLQKNATAGIIFRNNDANDASFVIAIMPQSVILIPIAVLNYIFENTGWRI
jgi:hypothetical protein